MSKASIPDRQSLIVEIVGAAGVGKTTIVKALSRRDERVVAGVHLSKMRHVPHVIRNTLLLMPTFLLRYRKTRWFTWKETRSMTYVNAWHACLMRLAPTRGSVTLFDHGPIFRLVRLQAFGPEITKSRAFEEWWEKAFQPWTTTLDMVIWLDAPDAVLRDRINARSDWHLIRGRSDREMDAFLARYRKSYERILERLTVDGGPKLVRFDTSRESVDEIADSVLNTLGFET